MNCTPMSQTKVIPGWGRYAASCDGRIMGTSRRGIMFQMKPSLNPRTGYLQINLYANNKPRTFTVHRLIAETFLGLTDEYEVDHINLKKTDNRIGNLRIATRTQNAINKLQDVRNSSGYTGVKFRGDMGKWISEIRIAGKTLYLGSYANMQDAINARIMAEKTTGYANSKWEDNILTKNNIVYSWLEDRSDALASFVIEASKRTQENEWLAGETPQKFVADQLDAWLKDNPFPKE